MHYRKEDIENLDRITRLKIINSVTGIKPANLIGTIDKDKISNLAIFSSVIHLGSNPALIGFISRPQTDEVGHTFTNIMETGYYTINHIHPEFIKKEENPSLKDDIGKLAQTVKINLTAEIETPSEKNAFKYDKIAQVYLELFFCLAITRHILILIQRIAYSLIARYDKSLFTHLCLLPSILEY